MDHIVLMKYICEPNKVDSIFLHILALLKPGFVLKNCKTKQDGGLHKLHLFILKTKEYLGAEQLGPDVFHHIWKAVLGEIPQFKDTAGGTSLRSRP